MKTERTGKAVLDSYAILAFLFGEHGASEVRALFDWAVDNGERHLVTAVNWAEIRYIVERKISTSKWEEARRNLHRLPLELVPVDEVLAELAGEFKLRGGVSLADCFAAALAKQCGLPLYSGDPEFRRLDDEIQIRWF